MRKKAFSIVFVPHSKAGSKTLTVSKKGLKVGAIVIGLSILSGAHLPIAEKLMDGLKKENAADILVVVGGNIPKRDHDRLRAMGVAGIFPTSTHFEKIADFIKEKVKAQ